MPTTTTGPLTGIRKAAILFILLGEEAASVLSRHLPTDTIRKIAQEIASIAAISSEVASQVLEEYYHLFAGHEAVAIGGADYANRFLVKAFGEERAKELLSHVSAAEESGASFEMLQRADPQQLARFLEGEHPQTIALILAHLGPKAAPALLLLPEKTRAEAVKRLAGLNQFSPETVRKILSVLERKVKVLGEQERCAYGGAKAVAELLNRMDGNASKAIIEMIEQNDPKQAVEIRNWMFTFDDLMTIPENGIRELLSQLDKKTLATALKGASDDVKNHIFKSMSSRAVEMLKEDMDALGPIRVRDAEQAKQEAIALLRKLEADGKLTLRADGDEYVI